MDWLRKSVNEFCDRLDKPEHLDERNNLVMERNIMNHRNINTTHSLQATMKYVQNAADYFLSEKNKDSETKFEAARLWLRVQHSFFLLVMDSFLFFIQNPNHGNDEHKTELRQNKRRRECHMWEVYNAYVVNLRKQLQEAVDSGDNKRRMLCLECRNSVMKNHGGFVNGAGEWFILLRCVCTCI